MKQSRLFSKTRKEAPADEISKNAQLLIRAGYIYKEMAGVYTLLPLGLRTVTKIAQIIRDEMNGLGAFEMQSSALQTKEVWEKTRWSDEIVDNWFKTKLKNDTELGLAFTHEEPLTAMMRNYLSSYKDLPAYVYDVKTVFRNEARAKSGLMRGREFFWKALYSFSKNKEEHDLFYEKITQSYLRIFDKVGLGDTTYLTFASGGSFAKYSHEFQTISDAGEDTIYVHQGRRLAVNKEVYVDEVLQDLDLNAGDLVEHKAVEVGNIFSLGSKFSEPLELKFTNEQGEQETVFMGSYGIGITRLLGVVAENLSDEKGLILPESIAPFKLHLLVFGSNDALLREANELYQDLTQAGIEVLYDDRESLNPGEKLRDADLLGIPYRLVLSEKSQQNGGVEVTHRLTGKTEYLDIARITHHSQRKNNYMNSFVEQFYNRFSNDIGIDLGTANTLVHVKGHGVVINEPSVVALNTKTDRVVAVGNDAREMLGRNPGHIRVVRPLVDGVISDFDVTEEMLSYLIRKAEKVSPKFFRPRVVVGVPSGITNVEHRAVYDAAHNAGAREVYIIEEPMAGAVGLGLPVREPLGSMVIDIGGGTTDIAIISLSGIVQSKNLKIAGDKLNQDIINYFRDEFKLLVGEKTAEEIKIKIGAVVEDEHHESPVRGRDIVSGLPRQILVNSYDIQEAIRHSISIIVEGTKEVLERTPPEIVSDVMQRGIYIIGGGAMIRGLDRLIEKAIEIPVYVAEDPLLSVVVGTGKVLENLDVYREVLIHQDDELPLR